MNTRNSLRTLLALAVLAIAACGQEPPAPAAGPAAETVTETPVKAETDPQPGEFRGEWTLSQLEGTMIHGGIELPTLLVGEDGSVSGFSGVNRYTGRLTPAEPTLFGPLATTRRAGPPAAMELETRFLAHLQQATDWRMESGELVLSAGDAALARFRPAAE